MRQLNSGGDGGKEGLAITFSTPRSRISMNSGERRGPSLLCLLLRTFVSQCVHYLFSHLHLVTVKFYANFLWWRDANFHRY